MKEDRILVLSVDRDNDIGEKAGVHGPIKGREEVLETGTKLGIKDPSDSDFNAVFEAVRVYDELSHQHKEAEVAIVTGDKNIGLASDRKIGEQLDSILKGYKAGFVVLVSDGSEDEHVLPLIQSRVPILSIKRVVVKQSEQLESSYYKIKDFITESLENPKLSRVVFGIPAIALLLIAVFGAEGWRAIMGVLGAYLIIKGFKLERFFTMAGEELGESFTRKRFAFFMYVLGIVIATLASYRGYNAMSEWLMLGWFETIAAFLSASIYFFWLAGSVAWLGRGISSKKRSGKRIASVPIFGFAIALVINNGSAMILEPATPLYNFVLSIMLGFFLMFVAAYLEKK